MSGPKIHFKYDKQLLYNTQKFIKDKSKVKIGILGSSVKGNYEGIDAVELAAVHEFGSISRNIPERSFLRKTYINYIEQFKSEFIAHKEYIQKQIISGNAEKVLNQIGAKWVGWVIETFENEGPNWKPLSDARIAQRSRTKRAKGNVAPEHFPILRDTGALVRSITYEVE